MLTPRSARSAGILLRFRVCGQTGCYDPAPHVRHPPSWTLERPTHSRWRSVPRPQNARRQATRRRVSALDPRARMKSAAGNQWRLATIGSVPQPRRRAHGRRGVEGREARRGEAPDRPSFRFTFKVAAFGGVLTQRRAVFLAEPRLKHAQCFTGNGHRRSTGHAHTNDDVGKVGSLLELVNTANRTRRKDLTGCAGVVGSRGQTVDSWPGLRQTQDVPRVAVRCEQLREESPKLTPVRSG